MVDVRHYGCFVEFDVEAEEGGRLPVYGLVGVNELGWEFCQDARTVIKVTSVMTELPVTGGIPVCGLVHDSHLGWELCQDAHAVVNETNLTWLDDL